MQFRQSLPPPGAVEARDRLNAGQGRDWVIKRACPDLRARGLTTAGGGVVTGRPIRGESGNWTESAVRSMFAG